MPTRHEEAGRTAHEPPSDGASRVAILARSIHRAGSGGFPPGHQGGTIPRLRAALAAVLLALSFALLPVEQQTTEYVWEPANDDVTGLHWTTAATGDVRAEARTPASSMVRNSLLQELALGGVFAPAAVKWSTR
jgi:hypothetical protein